MASTITVVCPHCTHRMRVSSEYVGRKGRCPTCKALVEVVASADTQSSTAVRPAAASARGASRRVAAGSTDAPAWLTCVYGAAAAALVWVLALQTPWAAYFRHGSWITGCNLFITCWGIAILIFKYQAVRREQGYAELELDFIPLDIGLQIMLSNVDQFLEHLSWLRYAQRRSILGRRIHGALEHFKSRAQVPEVQEYLASQAQIDASGVESGYTLLRSFIWCNPILGFIGTVLGISLAVGGLTTTFGAGADLSASLGQVTAGLATAFDTTLIGLAMTILLLFPTEALRKKEYRMLDKIEAFTNESLLRRMSEEGGATTGELPDVVRSVLESAFREHQRWLMEWQAQVSRLGQTIGTDFEAAIDRIRRQLAEAESARLVQPALSLDEVFDGAGQATLTYRPRGPDISPPGLVTAVEKLEQAADRLGAMADRLDRGSDTVAEGGGKF